MGLKFRCPECGGFSKEFEFGLGELTNCTVCGKRVEIPVNHEAIEQIPTPRKIRDEVRARSLLKKYGSPKRDTFITVIFWFLLISNLLAGLMTLTSYYFKPAMVTDLGGFYGYLYLAAVPALVAVIKRLRWGVYGYILSKAGIVMLLIVEMRFDVFFKLAIGMFVFLLLLKSEWNKMK